MGSVFMVSCATLVAVSTMLGSENRQLSPKLKYARNVDESTN